MWSYDSLKQQGADPMPGTFFHIQLINTESLLNINDEYFPKILRCHWEINRKAKTFRWIELRNFPQIR